MNQKTNSSTTERRGSVVRRFNLVLLSFYILAILIAAPSIYYVTSLQVHDQAKQELSMLVDMVKSIQSFVAKDLRPYFVEHGLFYSPGFSGIVATSLIAENFKQTQPDYYIKNSSDNPLNPANNPQPLEMELLTRFRLDRDLKQWTQVGELNGKTMLISAAPKISKPGCLRCHGGRDQVVEAIRVKFPGMLGYNYQPGEVVGLSAVGVPMENVQALAMRRTAIVLGVLTLLFGVILIAVNRLVKTSLLTPILTITDAAHAISHGALDSQIEIERNDEIGDLARSVELVRRSFAKLMQRMQKR